MRTFTRRLSGAVLAAVIVTTATAAGPAAAEPGTQSLTASVSSTDWHYLSRFNDPIQVSPPITATATGGTGSYTYSWVRTGGDSRATASAPTSATTSWRRSLPRLSSVFQSYWVCVISDTAGNVGVTPTVTVLFERENGD